jgi:myo-inositol-1-phosphate synthase
LVAGLIANQRQLSWFGPQGQPHTANYIGCITQIPSRGKYGGVGFSDVLPELVSMNSAAVGGWDIRPTLLGDALFQQQILDYDLVRQVREEMNSAYQVYKGYYDPRFIGSMLHGDATHVLKAEDMPFNKSALLKAIDVVNLLREDIRHFKWTHGIHGHTTVIWSASVEPNCEYCIPGNGLDTAQELLASLLLTEEQRGGPLPPSLLYATAAILEGCSFVNGGSQNTVECNGLVELAQANPGVYCIGTDFKAGQTKFKTAAVEYIRALGLKPKVVASSNHLGNNDMKNLACSNQTLMAKLRVKHDIFAAWEECIDHKVAVMYTPYINDEKRDFVEYTSEAFLGQQHTMVTYTRAMDSVLCVPLLIDAAIWCDYFSKRRWPFTAVAKALAYLFKVPEGAAKHVDPGFFRQMEELKSHALAASKGDVSSDAIKEDVHTMYSAKSLPLSPLNTSLSYDWNIPHNVSVLCAGLACVDMELNNASGGHGGEAIETFTGVTYVGGGRCVNYISHKAM